MSHPYGNGMVVSPQPEASEAGLEILRAGGNAVDAAIAMAFVQGVVDPMMCGISGFGSMAVYDPNTGKHEYIDFHSPAPGAATGDMWEDLIEGEAREVGESLDALGAMLSQPVFASLVRIEGSGLTLRYDDKRSGRAWTVDGGRLELVRRGDDLRLRADLALLGGRSYVTTIESTVTGRIGSRAVTVAVQVEDMPARDIATQSAGLAWLGILDAPISGAFRLTTSLDGEIGPLNGTLQIGAGALAPEGTEEPVPFRSARSYFQYDPGTQAVSFNELSVQSAWVTAVAEGRIVLENIADGVPEAMIGQLRITELTTNPAGIYPVPLYLEGAEADMRLRLSPFRLELGRLDLRDRGETLRLSGWADAREEGWDLSLTFSWGAMFSMLTKFERLRPKHILHGCGRGRSITQTERTNTAQRVLVVLNCVMPGWISRLCKFERR